MIVEEINYLEPIKIAEVCSDYPGFIWFDSAQTNTRFGRYSFIGFDPFSIISSKHSQTFLNDQLQATTNPFELLEQSWSQFQLDPIQELPPFQGGIAGYFGYDLRHHLERLPKLEKDDMLFPDMMLGCYDLVLSFDHQKQRCWLFSSGFPEQTKNLQEKRAKKRLSWVQSLIKQAQQTTIAKSDLFIAPGDIQANFTKAEYMQQVQKVIDYILAGDIFEANFTQRFKTALPKNLTPFALYKRLRHNNPAPFAGFFNCNGISLASASPERFIKLHQKNLETCPIKGTRPRGNTPEQDEALAKELVASEKDWAENVMIVDLMRNDISKVCLDHSVKVPQLCGLESFKAVHHLVSIIHGTLKTECNPIDLLRATFPGGSITGAPKIRAMEIIAELEPTLRGPYCGSLGYIGFDGNMDTSIIIRTFAIKDQIVTYQAGGAIVQDSDPEEEYLESLAKAKALTNTLTKASL